MNPETTAPPTPTTNPPSGPDPLAPPPKNKRTKLFVALGAALIIIILAIIGFVVVSSDAGAPTDDGKQSKQFQNWLKPTEEIKIGSQRYVSVCQAFPRQTVESIFGQLTPQTVIQEDYLDYSVPDDALEQRLTCHYNPATTDKAMKVGLETEQYTEASEVQHVGRSFSIYRPEQVQEELDTYKKAVSSSNNKEAKKFLNKLEKSFATYMQYRSEYDKTKLADVNVGEMVLPISDTIAGASGDFAFTGAYGNTVYTVYHTPSSSKGARTISAYSSSELVKELVSMKKATEAVAKNLRNKSLDQSPAPTIIDGNTDTYGSTKILEPCAIMTPSVFTEITGGKQQNNPVDRTSIVANPSKERYTKQDKSLILPSNRCSRHATDAADANTYAWFELEYAASAEQAEDLLSKGFKAGPEDEILQTDADWALAYENVGRPDDFLYIFRTGPYVGHVTIYTRSGAGEADASREQYIKAINTLTAGIKQAEQKAE